MKRLFIICIICLLLACSGVSVSTQPPASYVPSYYETVPRSAASEELVVFATPTPEPTEAPTEAPTPEPTEVPTPEPTPDPGFMLAWISDTQSMITLRDLREDYLRLCDWLGEKASDGTIRAVLHSGDMVDDGSDYGQWVLFCEGLSRFEKKIPFYWAVGNHDEGAGLAEPWRDQPFVQALPPEQTYAEGGAYYTILEMKGTRFMLLSVSWHREENELTLEWMKGVCDAHPDLPVVLLIHGYLTADGELMYYAYELEHKLVARCPNIRLILSGHARGISHAAFQYDDDGDGRPDRTVNALMYDIQADIERYGYICLLHYNPLDNSLSVDSYSPLWDDYIYDDEHPELERFVLYDVF